MKRLQVVSLVSLIYDVAVGVALLLGREWLARAFGVPSPQPPIFVEVSGVFMIAIGIGYILPYRRPDVHRGYLWVMGPLLKGAGALTFVADHYAHGSPAAFLAFAATDAVLALATLWALMTCRAPRAGSAIA